MSKNKKLPTVLLVDGNNVANRAYYSVDPSLSAPDGTQTNAVKGFFNILLSDIKKVGASHVGLIFDKNGCDYRTALYPEYKATREADSEKKQSIRNQIKIIKQIAKPAGFKVMSRRGVEADDIIGSCVKSMVEDANIIVSTNDKDFAQLLTLSDRENAIGLLWPKSEGVAYREEVIGRYTVPPEQIVDWLALMSDTVDNIIGVHKCGEVTAAKLLANYGSLKSVMKAFDAGEKIGGKVFLENFQAAYDRLLLNKKLITIRKNLFQAEVERFSLDGFTDEDKFYKLCRKYGLKTLVDPMRRLYDSN